MLAGLGVSHGGISVVVIWVSVRFREVAQSVVESCRPTKRQHNNNNLGAQNRSSPLARMMMTVMVRMMMKIVTHTCRHADMGHITMIMYMHGHTHAMLSRAT